MHAAVGQCKTVHEWIWLIYEALFVYWTPAELLCPKSRSMAAGWLAGPIESVRRGENCTGWLCSRQFDLGRCSADATRVWPLLSRRHRANRSTVAPPTGKSARRRRVSEKPARAGLYRLDDAWELKEASARRPTGEERCWPNWCSRRPMSSGPYTLAFRRCAN